MVKDTVAERQVELTGRNVFVQRHETHMGIRPARLVDGPCRNVHAENVYGVQHPREQCGARPDPTSEVQYGFRRHVQAVQAVLQIHDAASREVFLVFPGYGQGARECRIVVRRISVEVCHQSRRRPRKLRTKLDRTIWQPRTTRVTDGMAIRSVSCTCNGPNPCARHTPRFQTPSSRPSVSRAPPTQRPTSRVTHLKRWSRRRSSGSKSSVMPKIIVNTPNTTASKPTMSAAAEKRRVWISNTMPATDRGPGSSHAPTTAATAMRNAPGYM